MIILKNALNMGGIGDQNTEKHIDSLGRKDTGA